MKEKDASSSLSRRKKPKLKLLVSFNGAFTLRRPSGTLRYTGGDTRLISVDRTITFSRLSAIISELINSPRQAFHFNYQLSDSDNEEKQSPLALIASDDDVRCMIDVFEKLETRGRYYRLWIYVCSHDEYVNFLKLRNVVCSKFDCVKFSDDCLRKVVLRHQLVANISEFIRELGLGSEVGRGRIDDENFVSPRFVRSLRRLDADNVECQFSDDNCAEIKSCVDDCRMLNVKDCEDYECNDGITMGRRSYVDLVDYKYSDVNSRVSRSFADSVSLAVSHSRTMDRNDMVGYRYDDDNFIESRSYADSVVLSASHSRPLILKDGNLGVGLNESDLAFVNAGRIGCFNSIHSIANLHCPRPYAIMSYSDAKCSLRSVEPAMLSNLNRENLVPCSVDSMTLRSGSTPPSCSNQLLRGLSAATSSRVSSDSGISNQHFSPGDVRKQPIYHSHSRSNPSNFTEIGNHRKVRMDGRPWMGRLYPGIQLSSGISKQGKIAKSFHTTLLKPCSNSSSQQVESNARASRCILNNLTSAFAFSSGSEGNIGEHESGVPQDENKKPECHFSYHDPLSGTTDQSFSSMADAEEFPACTEGVNNQIDFLSNCVPKKTSATNQLDASNISKSTKKAELGCDAKVLEMGTVCESLSKNQNSALITQESVNFSSPNLSLLSLDDLKSPTHVASSYIPDTSVKPQTLALHLMGQEHFDTDPQAQISNEAISISSSNKAMELHEENKQEAVLQQDVESALSIRDKDDIKKTCDESKANGEIPHEIASVYDHLAIGELQAIKSSDLEYIRELGSGTYGTVFYGKWKGSDVAIKKLKPCCFVGGAVEENRLIADFWKEARILGQLRHPNIVALYGVVTDGPATNLATVTEFMINGSLKQVFRRKDRKDLFLLHMQS